MQPFVVISYFNSSGVIDDGIATAKQRLGSQHKHGGKKLTLKTMNKVLSKLGTSLYANEYVHMTAMQTASTTDISAFAPTLTTGIISLRITQASTTADGRRGGQAKGRITLTISSRFEAGKV